MPCCFYILLLQVFGIAYVLLHIHVLTCVNIPIMLGHVTTQIKHADFLLTILLIILSIYVCTS